MRLGNDHDQPDVSAAKLLERAWSLNELSQRLRLQSGEKVSDSKPLGQWLGSYSAHIAVGPQRELIQQLADAIELLAAVLSSGVGLRDAFSWVANRCTGQIKTEIAWLVDSLGVGDSITQSLFEYEREQKHPALRELALKLALSDQLGTQVTSQLISLATALRGEAITDFRKLGAKKETYLLMPLVFLVLPITVLFALVPSVQFLQFSSI